MRANRIMYLIRIPEILFLFFQKKIVKTEREIHINAIMQTIYTYDCNTEFILKFLFIPA
jgi:hypothetical protein